MTAEDWLIFGIVYLVLCALVAWVAESRGHDRIGWFSIALLFSPLLAFVAVILVGRRA